MPTIKGVRVPDKELRYEAVIDHTGADDISTVTVYLSRIRLVNTTGAAITVTIQDGQDTPLDKYDTVSIAANSVAHENFEVPHKCVDGLTAQASATGLFIEVFGWQNPS